MELHLTENERAVLRQVLRNYLGDLRMEIRDTDSFDFRQALKDDERALGMIIGRLDGQFPVEAAQTP